MNDLVVEEEHVDYGPLRIDYCDGKGGGRVHAKHDFPRKVEGVGEGGEAGRLMDGGGTHEEEVGGRPTDAGNGPADGVGEGDGVA